MLRAKVLCIEQSWSGETLEKHINLWLAAAGAIKVESVTPTDNWVLIFYSDVTAQPVKTKAAICTQCRKNPPVDGLKVCEDCRSYQADYRKKRKDEKKVRYP